MGLATMHLDPPMSESIACGFRAAPSRGSPIRYFPTHQNQGQALDIRPIIYENADLGVMRVLGFLFAAFMLSTVTYAASVEAEGISFECIPDDSSYSHSGNWKQSGPARLGPYGMLKHFTVYIPSGSPVAYLSDKSNEGPASRIFKKKVVVTPASIEIFDRDTYGPSADFPIIRYIDRISGEYKQVLDWSTYGHLLKESTSGKCRKLSPTNRVF